MSNSRQVYSEMVGLLKDLYNYRNATSDPDRRAKAVLLIKAAQLADYKDFDLNKLHAVINQTSFEFTVNIQCILVNYKINQFQSLPNVFCTEAFTELVHLVQPDENDVRLKNLCFKKICNLDPEANKQNLLKSKIIKTAQQHAILETKNPLTQEDYNQLVILAYEISKMVYEVNDLTLKNHYLEKIREYALNAEWTQRSVTANEIIHQSKIQTENPTWGKYHEFFSRYKGPMERQETGKAECKELRVTIVPEA